MLFVNDTKAQKEIRRQEKEVERIRMIAKK